MQQRNYPGEPGAYGGGFNSLLEMRLLQLDGKVVEQLTFQFSIGDAPPHRVEV